MIEQREKKKYERKKGSASWVVLLLGKKILKPEPKIFFMMVVSLV